ncbi:S24/S26 family peptidase [Nannocystis bainbridge]|uniref:S24/S26 family peptidase n=1 Tax=Nannocystis bainbridge TaxID=2995303 RepID=A0ABT5DRH6_9BACT|nr:S24/S26 family peptidase [Nannocystis bainbridge]MDC0715760.1 S24/S26 family peptidase [Nannocystis bainbridge]
MGWARYHIEKLRAGTTVKFRPHGNSMTPRIKSGQLCTVEPIDLEKLETGDVVLCQIRGADYLHIVKAIASDGRYQIGNNHGKINGWIGGHAIFGRLVAVEP